jgi:ArsR family transcriptional regulator, arsenate/arsenite/antimonite-responsive transcriptional repressor
MELRDLLSITKALADENRLRMLLALGKGELCVCQIAELFDLAVSTTSKHLAILYQARLVQARKHGRWMYYSLPDKQAPAAASKVIDWAVSNLDGDDQIDQDAARLKKVLATDIAELCERKCRS